MIEIEKLPVRFHQQDTEDYCGPATIQMVLHHMGTALIGQEILWATCGRTADSLPWYSGPDGVTDALNLYNPLPHDRFFFLYHEYNADILSRKIAWTIHRYKVAPIALIYDAKHWVAVTGFVADRPPNSPIDTSIILGGFWMHNPAPQVPVSVPPAPPPPHDDTDVCGDIPGGPRDDRYHGHADEFISYDEWQRTLTRVIGGNWDRQFVAICDPEPPPSEPGKREPFKPYFNGDKIITTGIIKETARKVLLESALKGAASVEHFLKMHLSAREPVLVEYLDRRDSFYYIVPMQNEQEKIVMLLSIDARFGTLGRASFMKKVPFTPFVPMTKNELLEVLGKKVHFKGKGKSVTIYAETLTVYPTLVWRPCLESLTPWIPFYMVFTNNFRIFIRSDKAVFAELTDNIYGA